jgi:flagellar biosynthesis/type III secretory pathway protein FliH
MIRARLLPTSLQPEISLETYRNLIAQGRQVIAQDRTKSRRKALQYAHHIRERGYKNGYEAGLQAAHDDCQAALHALRARYEDALLAARADALALAQSLAEQLVDRAFLETPEALARWINDSIALVKRSRTLKLTYNPRFEPIMQRILERIPQGVTASPDPTLQELDFVLEGEMGGVEFAWKDIMKHAALNSQHEEAP